MRAALVGPPEFDQRAGQSASGLSLERIYGNFIYDWSTVHRVHIRIRHFGVYLPRLLRVQAVVEGSAFGQVLHRSVGRSGESNPNARAEAAGGTLALRCSDKEGER